jgi:O-methyltransferase involved in polyketide biosynthesis
MAAYIAARTEFFDNRLLQACELGCQQVVIVGAGYDGRIAEVPAAGRHVL